MTAARLGTPRATGPPPSVLDALERPDPVVVGVLELAHLGDRVCHRDQLVGRVAAGHHHAGLRRPPRHPGRSASASRSTSAAAAGLRSALAPHGVAVRDCASFGLVDHVRIAVPGTDDLPRLATALDAAWSPR